MVTVLACVSVWFEKQPTLQLALQLTLLPLLRERPGRQQRKRVRVLRFREIPSVVDIFQKYVRPGYVQTSLIYLQEFCCFVLPSPSETFPAVFLVPTPSKFPEKHHRENTEKFDFERTFAIIWGHLEVAVANLAGSDFNCCLRYSPE